MKYNFYFNKRIINYLIIIITIFNYTSCNKKIDIAKNLNNKIDPNLDLSYDQYKERILAKKIRNNNLEDIDNSIIPPIPDIVPIITPHIPPKLGREKLVTITVTEDVPLKDVLIELSRLADIDIELDSGIQGGIILKVKDKPFSEVIERICNLANLRFAYNNGVLQIERDKPYLENYSVDFLNINRSNSNSSQLSTSLASTSGATSGNNGNLGSTTALKSSYDGDLWLSVENDLKKILNLGNAVIQETDSNNKTNTISSSLDNNYISINKQASMISIYATKKLHKQVKIYINKIKKASSAQVLIEAKIIEVNLNDEYKTGINWSELNNKISGGTALGFNFTSGITDENKIQFAKANKYGIITANTGALAGTNLQNVVEATQTFGSTRTLASPRIHAMNNQQAILSFVENKVYFTLKVDQTQSSSTNSLNTTTVNSSVNSVPIGVIIALQPSINLENDEITMNIRPTITSTDAANDIADPAVQYIVAQSPNSAGIKNLSSKVPTVNIKEIDSILKIKNGQIMVIGGMMEEISINKDTGIPFLMSTPIIGNLFKSTSRSNNIIQTIIFIKATIMPTDNVSNSDREFYNNFARDKETIY